MFKTTFISGSMGINTLIPSVYKLLDNLIANNVKILIGDCKGIDSIVQNYLYSKGYTNVTVYHTGKCRYNKGFSTKQIELPIPWVYGYYYYKDRTMVQDSDSQLVIWDGKSKGSFLNTINGINRGNYIDVIVNNKLLRYDKIKLKRQILDIFVSSNNFTSPVEVINIHHKQHTNYEYIGRGTKLGNKFTHLTTSKYKDIVICKDRDEAVDRHYLDFNYKFYSRDVEVVNEIRRLWKTVKEKGSIKLGCYCYPKRCHGDNIKEILDELYCIERIVENVPY